MNLSKRTPVSSGRKAKPTLRRTASIHSSDAARFLSEREQRNGCLTTSRSPFSRANQWERLRSGVTVSCCAHGRSFSAAPIEPCHYDRDDQLTGCFSGGSPLQ